MKLLAENSSAFVRALVATHRRSMLASSGFIAVTTPVKIALTISSFR